MNSKYCLFKTEKKRVVWEVTHKCNYACLHCCSRSGKNGSFEMNYENVIGVLNQLSEQGVEEIYYSGGEPFIREDMLDILTETRKQNILANVSTNGSFMTKEFAEQLKRIDVNLIHISLDSHIEKQYNLFRGGDYFNKTISAIKNAKGAGLYVRVGVVLWKENIDSISEMIDFFKNMDVDEVVFNWLVKVGRLKENDDKTVSLDKFDEIIGRINKLKRLNEGIIKISMHRSEKFKEIDTVCQAGAQILFILPDGRVSPCSWLAKLDERLITEQSLVDTPLEKIYRSKEFALWKEILDDRGKKCNPGCPAICIERNGKYDSEDPLAII